MRATIRSIAWHVPERLVTNAALAQEFPDWTAEKIQQKTGVLNRHVAGEDECASDLACAAAEKLFESGACSRADVDFVLLCTQSPDYFLPSTACILQHRLGLPQKCGALDFNLGCSGYVYGLSLAKGLIETGQARCVLLLTAETYSKYIDQSDRGLRTIFGDAAAATLIVGEMPENGEASDGIGPFEFGTDGGGARHLIVPAGAARPRDSRATRRLLVEQDGAAGFETKLSMQGQEIFAFTLRTIPALVDQLLARAGLVRTDIDLFVFHQANRYMLEHLRNQLQIAPDKFPISMQDVGNTVSSSIPIALRQASDSGALFPGARVMLVGFGVGYSWAATLIRWRTNLKDC